MKKLIPLLLLTGCFLTKPHLSVRDYEQVERGSSVSSLVEEYGDPDDIRFGGDGMEEYVYTDRIEVSPRITEHVYYIFRVNDDGAIVDKEIERSEPPPVVRILRRPR